MVIATLESGAGGKGLDGLCCTSVIENGGDGIDDTI
jgi:hypothetical protein